MRSCAKIGCERPAFSTITLAYQERKVIVGSLAPQADPNLLELCFEHSARMTPPVGWRVFDERAEEPSVVP